MPTDGIKGKTWGPSTLHQRERVNLPALSQASASTPQFSKSAPNLDKSRVNGGAGSSLLSSGPAHTDDSPDDSSSNIFLGKSIDGLNQIRNGSSNSTGYRYKVGSSGALHDNDDDDDDDCEVRGCFAFIRGDDSLAKRKKHSFDSKMSERQTANFIIDRLHDPRISSDCDAEIADAAPRNRSSMYKSDEPPYDRVFYRNIQKSLEDIFARDDYNDQFASQKSRNSKSSGDLTMCTDEESNYGHYRFQRLGNQSSKFNRECFLVNQDKHDTSDGSDLNISIQSNNSASTRNRDSSRKSSTEIDTSFGSLNLNGSGRFGKPNDEHTNSICSDDHSSVDMSLTPSASRKGSVTFRVDGFSAGNANPDQLIYANLSPAQNSFADASDIRTKFIGKAKTRPTRYAFIAFPKNQLHLHSHKSAVSAGGVVLPKSALAKKEKKDKPKSKYKLSHLLRFPRKGSVLHSNSFYKKAEGKTEMNQQLLSDDDPPSKRSPHYDVVRVNNFVLAKSDT